MSVAVTGICIPIALSFVLQPLAGAVPLQAFAAGAALCSTSLGTTFTVLSTSGLTDTRLGVVLSTAAMMDDVIGLVMVRIIANLGAGSSIRAVTILRPAFVSFAFFLVVPLLCCYIVRPVTLRLKDWRKKHDTSRVNAVLQTQHSVLLIHTLLLVAMVTVAEYAGTSGLFAAYLAGACISWWDANVPHYEKPLAAGQRDSPVPAAPCEEVFSSQSYHPPGEPTSAQIGLSGSSIYDSFYSQAVNYILKPLFFVSSLNC